MSRTSAYQEHISHKSKVQKRMIACHVRLDLTVPQAHQTQLNACQAICVVLNRQSWSHVQVAITVTMRQTTIQSRVHRISIAQEELENQ